MKKFLFLIMIIAIFIAFYEQNRANPNVIITCLALVVFMFGMIKLSSKIPPKDTDDDHKEI
jgi:Ca2+/Na+ antiporter